MCVCVYDVYLSVSNEVCYSVCVCVCVCLCVCVPAPQLTGGVCMRRDNHAQLSAEIHDSPGAKAHASLAHTSSMQTCLVL